MALDPHEQEINRIYDFLEDVYPDAWLMQPATEVDPEELLRMHEAGFGLADVAYANGESDIATYIRDPDNVIAKAIVAMAAAENADEIPEGSHALAIDSIKFGMPFPLLDTFVQLVQ